jgi:GntR family transcriptional regulator
MAADESLWNLSALAIDRSSPLPLYSQLKRVIADRIESSAFAPDGRLPSEQEPAARFALSRATARKPVVTGMISEYHCAA